MNPVKSFRKTLGSAISIGLLVSASISGYAQQMITLDENGLGYITPSLPFAYTVAAEPISGISTLRYTLPFAGVAGDVRLVSTGGTLSDLLRFDGASHVWFFSDMADGGPATLADVGLLPAPGSPSITLLEQPSGQTLYIPNAVNPGYKAAGPVAYLFVSEVPEPSTMTLAGLAGLLWLFRARRN